MLESVLKDANIKKLFVLSYDSSPVVLDCLLDAVSKVGAKAFVCDIVSDEPDLTTIDCIVQLLNENKSEAVLAFGGGSILDSAKAVAMIARNGGSAKEYQMDGRAIILPTLPLIMIPTTAGTGSETNKTAVLRNPENHLKKSIHSPLMVATTVILDPTVTLALPANITAFTGIDALSHAIESYVSTNSNYYTQMHSIKAIELIGKSLTTAVNDGCNITARADMLYASYFAGCALNAGIGLAHIIAQPVGGLYKVPHGEACSIYLPYSMEYNIECSTKEYCDIGRALGLKLENNSIESAKITIKKVKELIMEVNTSTSLTPYLQRAGVELNDIKLTETVQYILNATGHIKCNPRPVDGDIIKEVLKLSLH